MKLLMTYEEALHSPRSQKGGVRFCYKRYKKTYINKERICFATPMPDTPMFDSPRKLEGDFELKTILCCTLSNGTRVYILESDFNRLMNYD